MRPAPFRYHAPRSTEEVLSLLAEYGDEARLLAGGQSSMPLMNLRMVRPAVLIDLNHVARLDRIETGEGYVVFGPMVRQRDAELSSLVRMHCSLIAHGLFHAGPLAVRNRATVGGTLAHADRTAELPGVAAALEATFFIEGATGRRAVGASDFFRGDLTTAIETGEMLAEIRFPVAPRGGFSIFLEAGTRQRDMAVAGLAAWLDLDRDGCRAARFALIGVAPTPVRLPDVEAVVIAEGPLGRNVADSTRQAVSALELVTDVHATAEYRAHLAVGLIKQAIEAAARSLKS